MYTPQPMFPRLRFYWVVAVCGAVLMALEILSSRVLAPHYGNSVYVWGSIISVFLAALSIGYLLGGRLADRQPSMASLGRMVALAAAFVAVLLLFGTRLAAALAAFTGGNPSGTLLATAVLFGPASVLLATVSPWAVRIAARDLGHLGNTAGRLFALSTLGSLAGTLACTFLFIPFLELRQILALLTALTALTACVALAGSFRAEAPAAGLAVLLLLFSIPGASLANRGPSDLIYERVTPYQTLQVYERDGARTLQGDRVPQASVRLSDHQAALPYNSSTPVLLLVAERPRRALMIGLGGGTVGRYLQAGDPDLDVQYVEIDPAVPTIAERYLFFRPGPRMRVAVEDGRQYLHASQEKWDLVFTDAYIGQSVPFHLTTVEYLDEVKRHLNPGGAFGLNLAAGLGDPFSQAMYRTIRERFNSVYVFPVRRATNAVVVASDGPPLSKADLLKKARELDRTLRFDPPLAALAAWRGEVALDTTKIPILTDDFAPTDRLIHLGSHGNIPAHERKN
jgi:spermidine synthase